MAAQLEEQQFCCCRVRGVYLGGLARLWLERVTRGKEAEWRDVSDQGSLDWNVSTMVSPMPLEPSFRRQGYCQSPRCERIRGSDRRSSTSELRTRGAFDSPLPKESLRSGGLGWPWVQRGCDAEVNIAPSRPPAHSPAPVGCLQADRLCRSADSYACLKVVCCTA